MTPENSACEIAPQRSERSITRLIRSVQQDPQSPAINELLARLYQSQAYRQAIRKADHRIALATRAAGRVSGEDIAQEAFHQLFKRTQQGKISRLDNRDHLFAHFMLIVATKTRKRLISENAIKRRPEEGIQSLNTADENSESSRGPVIADQNEPSPEEVSIAREMYCILLQAIQNETRHERSLLTVLDGLIHNRTLAGIATEISSETTIAEVRTLVARLRSLTRTLFAEDLKAAEQECQARTALSP